MSHPPQEVLTPATPSSVRQRIARSISEIGGIGLFLAVMTVIVLGIAAGGAITFLRHDPATMAVAEPASGPRSTGAEHRNEAGPDTAAPQVIATPSNAVLQSGPYGEQANVAQSKAANAKFVPLPEGSMPGGEYGNVIRQGEQIFRETTKYAGKYAGNDLSCANCHLDAGRKPDSAPMWAAFIHYPAYRSKTGAVDTLASRIQGCFRFSMNGKAPPQDDDVMTALQTYFFWLAKGAPVGTEVAGSGYPRLKKPAQAASYQRGAKVFEQNCALCHGADGLGQRAGDHQVFPPLWGPRSFNWGAGMHQLGNAAGFIKANMPLGRGGTLSDQDAWDVALFMNSHERPQDPRFTRSVAETRKKYHDTDDSMYGMNVGGHVLGSP